MLSISVIYHFTGTTYHGGDSRVGPGRRALLGGPPRRPSALLVCGELRKVTIEYIAIQMQRTINKIPILILQVPMRKLTTHAYVASPN